MTTLAFYVVLQVAASNDLIANKLAASVQSVTRVFQVLIIVLPPLVGYVTYRLMKGLKVSRAERFGTVPLEAMLHPKRYDSAPEQEASEEPEESTTAS